MACDHAPKEKKNHGKKTWENGKNWVLVGKTWEKWEKLGILWGKKFEYGKNWGKVPIIIKESILVNLEMTLEMQNMKRIQMMYAIFSVRKFIALMDIMLLKVFHKIQLMIKEKSSIW